MPTYEYECTQCGQKFDLFQPITAKPIRRMKKPCDNCGQLAPVRRLISGGGAVLFKGSGFYETDYRSDSYKKSAEAETNGSKSKDTAKKKDVTSDSKPTAKESGKSESKSSETKSSGSGEK